MTAIFILLIWLGVGAYIYNTTQYSFESFSWKELALTIFLWPFVNLWMLGIILSKCLKKKKNKN